MDVLKISIPEQEIIKVLKFKEGNLALIMSGKNIGQVGKIETDLYAYWDSYRLQYLVDGFQIELLMVRTGLTEIVRHQEQIQFEGIGSRFLQFPGKGHPFARADTMDAGHNRNRRGCFRFTD